MACGRPIVASDLPVLKEILSSNNAVLCQPEDLNEWCTAILNLDLDYTRRCKLSQQALNFSKLNTWEQRVAKILPLYD